MTIAILGLKLGRPTKPWILAAAAPVVLTFVAGLDLPTPGPSRASAGNAAGPMPPAQHAGAPLSTEQRRALDWVGSAAASPLASPFTPRIVEIVGEVPVPSEPQIAGVPELRLSAVLRANNATMATINGKLRRVGETVAPGVELIGIDARNQRATVRLEDGREIVLSAPRPVLKRDNDPGDLENGPSSEPAPQSKPLPRGNAPRPSAES